MTSVDSIINYEKTEREDYYGILGCDESASEEQINTEYKVRALQYHPDKNPDDKDAEAKFQLLTEAKETLLDPEKRKNYDKWKNSGISISYKGWMSMKDHVHQSMHWATFKTKDRMLGEAGGAGAGGSDAASTSSPAARSSSVSAAARRASEGGANIHWGAKGTMKWDKDASSDVVNKFRNYEI